MLFDFAELSAQARYKLLASTVTPRPIAWVVSQDAAGRVNAAPFSFFNVLAGDPPTVGISIGSRAPGQPKDTLANIRETGEFVVNLVSRDNAEAMNKTATEFPPGVDELTAVGLTRLPSVKVTPPRIGESPVAFECKLFQAIPLGPANTLVLGHVVAMHVRDDAVLDALKHYIDTPKLDLVGRMHGGGGYTTTRDQFQIRRIPYEDWDEAAG
jgi:flavin reductase (DIM6/NTAB) family NADH-FMN oxidoreductase RutF